MGKTVFCVDDSPSIRMLVRKTLEPQGYQIREANNGQEALEALSSDAASDMFIVDVNMPVMGGFDFVKELKSRAEHSQTPAVFLTTESGDEKKNIGKDLGVKGWIVKPFEGPQLIKIVDLLTS